MLTTCPDQAREANLHEETLAAVFFFCALPLFCQSNTGELRLKVTDPSGLGVKTTVQISARPISIETL